MYGLYLQRIGASSSQNSPYQAQTQPFGALCIFWTLLYSRVRLLTCTSSHFRVLQYTEKHATHMYTRSVSYDHDKLPKSTTFDWRDKTIVRTLLRSDCMYTTLNVNNTIFSSAQKTTGHTLPTLVGHPEISSLSYFRVLQKARTNVAHTPHNETYQRHSVHTEYILAKNSTTLSTAGRKYAVPLATLVVHPEIFDKFLDRGNLLNIEELVATAPRDVGLEGFPRRF